VVFALSLSGICRDAVDTNTDFIGKHIFPLRSIALLLRSLLRFGVPIVAVIPSLVIKSKSLHNCSECVMFLSADCVRRAESANEHNFFLDNRLDVPKIWSMLRSEHDRKEQFTCVRMESAWRKTLGTFFETCLLHSRSCNSRLWRLLHFSRRRSTYSTIVLLSCFWGLLI